MGAFGGLRLKLKLDNASIESVSCGGLARGYDRVSADALGDIGAFAVPMDEWGGVAYGQILWRYYVGCWLFAKDGGLQVGGWT